MWTHRKPCCSLCDQVALSEHYNFSVKLTLHDEKVELRALGSGEWGAQVSTVMAWPVCPPVFLIQCTSGTQHLKCGTNIG
jgi:hypothetical protein